MGEAVQELNEHMHCNTREEGAENLRLVIGGTNSSVGKTSITLAIEAAALKRGLKVQSFKVGPDYIDPSYHTVTTCRKCRNLDAWMVPERRIVDIIAHAEEGTDISIIEGVMGMYDGIKGCDDRGSTARISKLAKSPCILVVDAHSMARSAGAVVLGFASYDRRVNLAGVILNRVGSASHEQWCRDAISRTGIPVVGAVPTLEERLEERHLGLVPTPELRPDLERMTSKIAPHLDVDKLLEIATLAKPLPAGSLFRAKKGGNAKEKVRIGLAFDEAFNFYYWDALEILENRGAEIVQFSPIHDSTLPEVDGLYIGGGFPEVQPSELERNLGMRQSIKKAAEDGMPLLAECGGLMYLTRSITDFNGKRSSMVGFLEADTIMTRKLVLNYTQADVERENILSAKGTSLKGHEFHYSGLTSIAGDAKFAYKMRIGKGIDDGREGWISNNVLASYMHLHLASNLKLPDRLVASCKGYAKR